MVVTLNLVLGRDSEDVWLRFVQELVIWPKELVIWPKEVTLVSRTQPSGPLCLWQCFISSLYFNFCFDFYLISIFCVPEVHKGSLSAFLKRMYFVFLSFYFGFYCWNKLQLLFLPWLCPVLQCSIDTRMWLSARLVYLPSGRGLTRTNRDPPIMIHYLRICFSLDLYLYICFCFLLMFRGEG